MNDPFIIMCAPNGARRSRQDHTSLPITPQELADCAESIVDAGASMVHVHVRDERGGHTLDADRYRAAIAAIEKRVGDRLVIQVTTEACGIYSAEQQMSLVRDLRPQAVSVALRELCPDDDSVATAREFYRWMIDNRVMPQHILYSSEDVACFESLRAQGVIPDERPFVLFVLGRYAENLTGDVAELEPMIDAGADDVVWSVCCFGKTEHEAVLTAIKQGGHARVGFENNLLLPDGAEAPANEDLVRLAASAAQSHGRQIASADDVRSLFS